MGENRPEVAVAVLDRDNTAAATLTAMKAANTDGQANASSAISFFRKEGNLQLAMDGTPSNRGRERWT